MVVSACTDGGGVSASHFTNVSVPSVESLTVSALVSSTSVKSIWFNSVVEKIANWRFSYILSFLGIYRKRDLVALKFCWISCAVSALLYMETCGILPTRAN